MNRSEILKQVESAYLKAKIPKFEIGDTVSVSVVVKEGDKERNQIYKGLVIAKKGSGLNETFVVYRTAFGFAMERQFLLNSPGIRNVEVHQSGKVRRAKLYYLRGKTGKSTKLRKRLGLQEPAAATTEV